MPFSKWHCHLEVGEIALQHMNVRHDRFFIQWRLEELLTSILHYALCH
jgi:hypothetical protein